MVNARRLAGWRSVHSWTSLICTLFMLMLCMTGLPLIFIDEIDAHLAGDVALPPAESSIHGADLDKVAAAARAQVPGSQVLYIDWDLQRPLYGVNLGAPHGQRRQLVFDSRSGQYLEEARVSGRPVRLFLFIVNRLHIQLFAGLPGELFLGAIGLCFTAAVISGAVLYAPYVGPVAFGTLRGTPGDRRRTLDNHQLVGIVMLGWLTIIGITGFMNSIGQPGYDLWRQTTVPALLATLPAGAPTQGRESFQAAVDAATRALPSARMVRVLPPGARQGSPRHYLVWMQGNTPLTKRLFRPVLIDTSSGVVSLSAPAPWYLTVLQVARPLHFGDYGGMPLKVLWALFDVGAMIVLVTGLRLWLTRRAAERLE